MKKKGVFVYSVLLCLLVILLPNFVLAKNTVGDAQSFVDTVNQDVGAENTDIPTLIGKIIQVGLSVVGMVFFILIFYASFLWLISRGEEEQVKKARNIIIGSSIGLVIIVGSYALTNFVFNRVAVGRPSNFSGTNQTSDQPTGPLGCCLNQKRTPGGFWDQEISAVWWESVTDQKNCEKAGLVCVENEDDLCGDMNWEFIEGAIDPAICKKIALQFNKLEEDADELLSCDVEGNCD